MKLLSQKKYLKQKKCCCPVCFSEDVEQQNNTETLSGNTVVNEIYCFACGAIWEERFELKSYKLIRKNTKPIPEE